MRPMDHRGLKPDVTPHGANHELGENAMQRASISRRRMLACSAMLVCLALPALSWAQAKYPTKLIRVVVPAPAGTSPDVIARHWGERLGKETGQPVIIENRPGASTIIGAQAVAPAPADGYTLLYTVNNTLSINPYVYDKLPYKVDDFVPVIRILSVPYVLIVPANSSIKTLNGLISAAKANPGKLTYGSYGIGQGTHVAMAHFLNEAGVSMTHIPYKDAPMSDLIAGRIDVLVDASTTAIPQIKAGKAHALAVTGPQRVEALPNVPTVAETLPGFVGDSWQGVLAPKGTPGEVIATLARLSQKIIESQDFREMLRERGLTPAGGTPADFQKFLAADAKAWSKVVKDNNIKVE